MNFILANDRSGGTIELKTGGHLLAETTELLEGGLYPGDGDMYTLSGNFGRGPTGKLGDPFALMAEIRGERSGRGTRC